MSPFFNNLLLYSGMISASVVVGGIIPSFISWTRKQLHLLLSLSAGLMIGATFLHLLPDSIELIGREAPVWALAGFLFLYLIERFVTVHVCEAMDCEVHPMGIAAVVGISMHALTDGIALGSGLLVNGLGFIVFLTIFFHKLPEAFALTTILLHETKSRGRIIFFNILLIAMVPLGALLVYGFAGANNPKLAGIALAFSAGTFLHISLSDLLPDIHRHTDRPHRVCLCFLIGLAVMFFLNILFQHGGL
jgi:zinc and cadmium transporter